MSNPNSYPRTEQEATADRIARSMVRSGLHYANKVDELVGRDDDHGRALFVLSIKVLVGEYGIASLLRAFRAAAPEAADAAARDLYNAWEAGDAVHEWLHEWAEEYAGSDTATENNEA